MHFASVKLEDPLTYYLVEYYLTIWSFSFYTGLMVCWQALWKWLGGWILTRLLRILPNGQYRWTSKLTAFISGGRGTGGVRAQEKTGRGRLGGGCAKRVGNAGSKGKLHKKCFTFRNRKGAKGLKGGGRECKVRKAEGLDPLSPPPEQITIVCFPRLVPSLFVPKDQVYPVV